MKYYQNITLLPDAEANLGFLLQKVYQQIHIALVENKTTNNNSVIAISFPKYGDKEFPIGNKLRLLGPTQEGLEKLAITIQLQRLKDYVRIDLIKKVPDIVVEHVCFSRKQFKTNSIRLARRRAKRHGENFAQALQHYEKFEDKQTKLPYINVNSLSKGEQFKIYIKQDIHQHRRTGEFNCYGLSKIATIPWF